MATEQIRYGVVGCAGMGANHAEAARSAEGAELVACADLDESAARSLADRYGAEWYADPGEMATGADLDAASVCTPNGTHLEIVTALAEAGVDVLCEKPLEIAPERVDDAIAVCDREGVTLGGILQRRTLGGPRLARDAVRDGRLGDLTLADVEVKWHREAAYYEGWHGTRDLDGGILYTQALHGIDLLEWIAGPIERVSAELATRHHGVEVPDTAVASVEFADGGYGQITASTAVYPEEPIALGIHGTEGSIRWSEGGLESFETTDGPVDARPEPLEHGEGIPGQVRDFVTAVREGRDPMVPPSEARKPLDLIFALEAAAERDEWVRVDEFRDP